MNDLQRTFDGRLETPKPHPSDIVATVDGVGLERYRERNDCYPVWVPLLVELPSNAPDFEPEILAGKHDSLRVTYDDAKRQGFCRKGIDKFLACCVRAGYFPNPPQFLELGFLRKIGKHFFGEWSSHILPLAKRLLTEQWQEANKVETGGYYEYYYLRNNATIRERAVIDDVKDHNGDVFTEYFRNVEEWIEEYVHSGDYINNYSYIVFYESPAAWDRFRRYLLEPESELRDDLGIKPDASLSPEYLQAVWDRLIPDWGVTAELVNEYSSESNYYLDSLLIGEHEEQVDWESILEQTRDKLVSSTKDPLTDSEIRESFLQWAENQHDYCLHTDSMRGQYPCLELYVCTGLRVEWSLDTTSEELYDTFREVADDMDLEGIFVQGDEGE